MIVPQEHAVRVQALSDVDASLRREPEAVPLLFKRAVLLDELDDVAAAKDAYIAVLRRNPNHFGAMNNLATMLCRLGYENAAIPIFSEAVKQYPLEPSARVNFGNVLANVGHFTDAREQYEAAVSLRPDSRLAHQGLGNVLSALGDEAAAESHWKIAFTGNAIAVSPYFGRTAPIRVLTLYSQTDGNVPVDALLDSRVFQRIKVTVEYFEQSMPLPPHDVVFNAVGDVDRCPLAFDSALCVLQRTDAPIINHPSAVLQTSRPDIARRLRDLRDVVTPKMQRFTRAQFDIGAEGVLRRQGFAFPLLLRAPGFHTGQNFAKVDEAAAFADALAQMPADDVLVLDYLNARCADEKFRKFRVMFVEGELYPLHLAVSDHWKVHYFSADMHDSPQHRAEDAAFLENMPAMLGERAMQALQQIQTRLGLDYGGIDFALDADGRVLVFEANATMRVPRPPADPRWNYRRAPVQRILDAVAAMLASRCIKQPISP